MRGVLRQQPPPPSAEAAPYRYLAVRVIDQAFRDLASSSGSSAGQESARAFLAGSPMLHHWCEVADLDPARLTERATKLMASYTTTVTPTSATYDAETEKQP